MKGALNEAPRDTISAAINKAVQEGRPALIGFLTAGFPTRRGFADNLAAVAEVCDVVEVGVPFTDPMADGTTVQRASFAALADGVTLPWILEEVKSSRQRLAAPILLMSYLNPLLSLGLDALPRDASAAGVAGFIVPDLPFEESGDLRQALQTQGLALIQMVTPVTPPERLALLCSEAKGFVYAVTMTGTTGTIKGKFGASASGSARLHGPGQALFERPRLRGIRHPLPRAGGALRRARRWGCGGLRPGGGVGTRPRCQGISSVVACMKRVFRAASLIQVAHARNVLLTAGIQSELRNQYLAGALGDLPMLETWPQLYVDDADEQAALRALARASEAPTGASWTCDGCGEALEPQFTSCWRCGAVSDKH